MPDEPQQRDESGLRDLFASASAPNTLDADRIIAKARSRRAPKQVAAGLAGALAIAGVFVVAINTSQFAPSMPSAITSSDEASDTAAGSQEAETFIKRAPAGMLNVCGSPVAEVAASVYELQLDVEFPATATVGTAPIDGTVRLTNVSPMHVVGSTAAVPAVTVSQGGTVLWHTNGAMIYSLVPVDLEPGESLEYASSFTPVRCGPEDEIDVGFRADLPALPAGDYEVSALIDFSPNESIVTDGVTYLDLVSGPAATISLQ